MMSDDLNLIEEALRRGPIFVEHSKRGYATSPDFLTFTNFDSFLKYTTDTKQASSYPTVDDYIVWSVPDLLSLDDYFYYTKQNDRYNYRLPVPDDKLAEIEKFLARPSAEIIYCLLDEHSSTANILDISSYDVILQDWIKFNVPNAEIYIFPYRVLRNPKISPLFKDTIV